MVNGFVGQSLGEYFLPLGFSGLGARNVETLEITGYIKPTLSPSQQAMLMNDSTKQARQRSKDDKNAQGVAVDV